MADRKLALEAGPFKGPKRGLPIRYRTPRGHAFSGGKENGNFCKLCGYAYMCHEAGLSTTSTETETGTPLKGSGPSKEGK